MSSQVKSIDSIMNEACWTRQPEKTGTLQHQTDSHRAYLFNHELVKFNKKGGRVETYIDRLPKIFDLIPAIGDLILTLYRDIVEHI